MWKIPTETLIELICFNTMFMCFHSFIHCINCVIITDESVLKTSIHSEKNLPSIEMLGDNIDVTITPSKMTSDAQRKSLHWFLVMMKLKNITVKDMDVSEVCLCLSQVHVLSTF